MFELMSITQLELTGSMLAARVAKGKGDDGKAEVTSSPLEGSWQSSPVREIMLQRNSRAPERWPKSKAHPPP